MGRKRERRGVKGSEKMRQEQAIGLLPEKGGYPWQILEADGETWLIMRWKEKIATNPIEQLVSVVLEDFSWELAYEEGEKRFFSGIIGFKTNYRESGSELKKFVVKEPWREEADFRDFLAREKGRGFSLSFKKEERVEKSSFPSLLLDGQDLGRGDLLSAKNEDWEVRAPWHCWVRGTTGSIKPVCLKVHIAQVGLYTLLLEAIIKLGSENEENKDKMDPGFVKMEEQGSIWKVEGDSPGEILGMSVQRAFPRFSYNASDEQLLFENLKRLSLVYLSSLEGGERFFVAAYTGEEKIVLENDAQPLCPVEFTIKRAEQPELALVGENQLVYREKECYCLQKELSGKKERPVNEGVKPINKEKLVPPKRNKPGDKWLKKGEVRTSSNFKKVLTIKI